MSVVTAKDVVAFHARKEPERPQIRFGVNPTESNSPYLIVNEDGSLGTVQRLRIGIEEIPALRAFLDVVYPPSEGGGE